MKIIIPFFLSLGLMLLYVPFAYSAAVASNKVVRPSSAQIELKQRKQSSFGVPNSSEGSFDDSRTTYERAFRLIDNGRYVYERSLSPRSQSSISEITFDNSTNMSVDGDSSDDELESNPTVKLEGNKNVFQNPIGQEFGRSVNERMSGSNGKKIQDIQKRGREWLKAKETIFNAINSSIVSLIRELENISERPRCQIQTSLYLIEGYKNVCDDAIAVYEDFLNGTSGNPMNEDELIKAANQLIDDMVFSIDHIVFCINESDLKKYRILPTLKENVKNWKYKLGTTARITPAEGVKFRRITQRESVD